MASKVLKISAHSSISTEYCLTLRNNNHCKQCSLKCVQGDTSETRISLSTPHFLGACGTWADKPQPNKHLLERKWYVQHRYIISTNILRRSLQNIFENYTNVVVCLRHGVLICESGMLTAVVLWHFLLMSKLRLGSVFVPRVLCSAVYCSLCVLCSMFSVLGPYLLRASHGVNT